MAELRCRVAGVTFMAGYPRNLADLARRCAVEPVAAELVREHDNGYDLNAVAVHIEGRIVGHVPADMARRLAPLLDGGFPLAAEALFVAVDDEHKDRPGLEIRIFTKETVR